ncbi:MAG TPA: TolC family protein [Roseimicrobium sp.]|nr:TolC family protein [Roseimicrobium sp.]
MKRSIPQSLLQLGAVLALTVCVHAAETNSPAKAVALDSRPLSVEDALNIAIQQNPTVAKARKDVEAAYGISIQTRAVANPKVQFLADAHQKDRGAVETFAVVNGNRGWDASLRVIQTVYAGGKIQSALRTSKLTQEQALLDFQSVVLTTLLQVRETYYDVLLARQQIIVQEASLELLQRELNDQTRRFEAGTVPRFNVLRAEVEVANARPKLIRARNSLRVSKDNLATQLGYDIAKDTWDNLPLQLSGSLEPVPYDIVLPQALADALQRRPELLSLYKSRLLRGEDLTVAKAGYHPQIDLFAGIDSHSSVFSDDLTRDVTGWIVGGQLTWNIWDGNMTKGRIAEAKARADRSQIEITDVARKVELEVRTAYSNFIEAKEVLESQKKVQEQADEALRLATARSSAGTGTQLDVLSAQTALTEARTTQIQAQRDYAVARARLERAIGIEVTKVESPAVK